MKFLAYSETLDFLGVLSGKITFFPKALIKFRLYIYFWEESFANGLIPYSN